MLKLRRIVSSESWVPEIDGLRFVAILSVLLFHISGEITSRGLRPVSFDVPVLARMVGNGDRGVGLFFVISGFVLARPFFHQYRLGGREIKLRTYFLRRLTRLEPPFLICLLIYTLAVAVTAPEFLRTLAPHLAASALYVHNFVYPGSQPLPDFVTWSLEIEVQFYILAPLLGQIYRVRHRGLRRGVFLALTLLGCVVSIPDTSPLSLLNYAGFFPAGFLLADLLEDPERSKTQHWVWDAVGAAGWAALFLLPWSLRTRALLPLLIVPIYLTVFYGVGQRWLFRRTLLTTIGGMCYSIYLLHPLVISVAFRVAKRIGFATDLATFAVQAVLLLAACLLVGAVYFVVIERPCMNKRWPQELLGWVRLRLPATAK